MSMFAEFKRLNGDPMWANVDTVAMVGVTDVSPWTTVLYFVGGHTVAVQGTVEEAVAKLQYVMLRGTLEEALAKQQLGGPEPATAASESGHVRVKPHLPRPTWLR